MAFDTLVDTGPLVALIDPKDNHRFRLLQLLNDAPIPWLTTVACITEALHLLGRGGGYRAQAALWRFCETGALAVANSTPVDIEFAASYMARFKDVPCDFADATLLVLAERTGFRRIITLDRHFQAYRVSDGHLEVLS